MAYALEKSQARRRTDEMSGRRVLAVAGTAVVLGTITLAQALPPTRAVPSASPHAAPGVSFEDVTERAGLSAFRHVAGSPGKGYIIEALGSGVAMLDVDGDGWLDVYLVNGGTLDPRVLRRGGSRRRCIPVVHRTTR